MSVLQQMLYAAWQAAGSSAATDPYFSNVALLLHMDGSNGGTTFTDSSQYARTVTVNGNTNTSTSQKQFGTASALFDEVGDYLNVTVPAPGATDFTIEGFGRFSVNPNGNGQGLFQLATSVLPETVTGIALGTDTANGRWAIYYGAGSTTTHASLAPSINTWYHWAMVRAGSTLKVFINGVEIFSLTDSTNYTATALVLGGWFSTVYLLNGNIDEVRYTQGIARYTNNFTVPTAAFPDAGPSQEVVITTPGTYSWTPPAGVTSINVVAVGPGRGANGDVTGGGGALGYRNNVSVTPGTSYSITVGGANSGTNTTAFSIVAGSASGSITGGVLSGTYDGGGNGGDGNSSFGGGKGGAGGAGGGAYNTTSTAGTNGTSGGGGGGGGTAGGGGGVGLWVLGTSGNAPGGGGSGGDSASGTVGGNYGAGGRTAAGGAVRIIWGSNRTFPSNSGPLNATWNPSDKDASITLSNGNLTAASSTGRRGVRATKALTAGKYYWEVTINSFTTANFVGIANGSWTLSTTYLGEAGATNSTGYESSGLIYYNGNTGVSGATFAANDVIGVTLDTTVSPAQLGFYKNNVLQYFSSAHIPAGSLYSATSTSSSGAINNTANFGQNPLKYTPPNGTFANPKDANANVVFSNNNLTVSTSVGSSHVSCRSNTSKTSGKWYWEVRLNTADIGHSLGIANASQSLAVQMGSSNSIGFQANGFWLGTTSPASGWTATAGDVIGMALDIGGSTLQFYKNGSLQGTVPFSLPSGALFIALGVYATSGQKTLNTGATPFAYTPPSGYSAWDATVYNAGVY